MYPVFLYVPHSLQVVLPVQLNTQQHSSFPESRLYLLPESRTGHDLPLALMTIEQRIELLALNFSPIGLCQIDLFLVQLISEDEVLAFDAGGYD